MILVHGRIFHCVRWQGQSAGVNCSKWALGLGSNFWQKYRQVLQKKN